MNLGIWCKDYNSPSRVLLHYCEIFANLRLNLYILHLNLAHGAGRGQRQRLFERVSELREEDLLEQVAVGGHLQPEHVHITVTGQQSFNWHDGDM